MNVIYVEMFRIVSNIDAPALHIQQFCVRFGEGRSRQKAYCLYAHEIVKNFEQPLSIMKIANVKFKLGASECDSEHADIYADLLCTVFLLLSSSYASNFL